MGQFKRIIGIRARWDDGQVVVRKNFEHYNDYDDCQTFSKRNFFPMYFLVKRLKLEAIFSYNDTRETLDSN